MLFIFNGNVYEYKGEIRPPCPGDYTMHEAGIAHWVMPKVTNPCPIVYSKGAAEDGH